MPHITHIDRAPFSSREISTILPLPVAPLVALPPNGSKAIPTSLLDCSIFGIFYSRNVLARDPPRRPPVLSKRSTKSSKSSARTELTTNRLGRLSIGS